MCNYLFESNLFDFDRSTARISKLGDWGFPWKISFPRKNPRMFVKKLSLGPRNRILLTSWKQDGRTRPKRVVAEEELSKFGWTKNKELLCSLPITCPIIQINIPEFGPDISYLYLQYGHKILMYLWVHKVHANFWFSKWQYHCLSVALNTDTKLQSRDSD